MAFAVIECAPAAAWTTTVRHGGTIDVPTDTPLSKNSTLAIVPLALLASPETTTSTGPSITEQNAGPVTTTAGAAPTMMSTFCERVVAPRSVAMALIVCEPGEDAVQLSWNGARGTSPTEAAPSKNSTRPTVPSTSVAVAEIVTVEPAAANVPGEGEVSTMLGGLLSTTVVETADDVVAARLSSYALAVSE